MLKFIKEALINFLAVCFIALPCYLLLSFVELTIYATDWSVISRAIQGIVTLTVIGLIAFQNVKDNGQER